MKKYRIWHDRHEFADDPYFRKHGLSADDIREILDRRSFTDPEIGDPFATEEEARTEFEAETIRTTRYPKGQSPYRNGHIECEVLYLMEEIYDDGANDDDMIQANELDFRAAPLEAEDEEESGEDDEYWTVKSSP